MKLHRSITVARITDAVEESMRDTSNPGFCIACGTDTDGVEPDAREYPCEACGQMAVYGAEELLLMVAR